MISKNKFMGFTKEELKKLFTEKQYKYNRISVKPTTCKCGTTIFYKSIKCPGCFTKLSHKGINNHTDSK